MTCELNEAQEYLLKLLKDHASNPSTDGLKYGMFIESGWKKLFKIWDGTNEDIDHVIVTLDTEDFWRKVWWRRVAAEDITLEQKKTWMNRAFECEIVGSCMTTDPETGKDMPENYPPKWRICKKCHAEFSTIETRWEHQTTCQLKNKHNEDAGFQAIAEAYNWKDKGVE